MASRTGARTGPRAPRRIPRIPSRPASAGHQTPEAQPTTARTVFETLVRDFSATAIELHGKASSTEAQQVWALGAVRKPGDRRGPRRANLRPGACAGRLLCDARL